MTSAFVRPLSQPSTAAAVARALPGSRTIGNPDRPIRAIGSLAARASDVLAFCDADAAARVAASSAAVVIVPAGTVGDASVAERTLIAVADVRAAFIDTVLRLLPGSARPADPAPGIDPRARVDPGAHVSPLACIGADVVIGAGSRVSPGAVVYADTIIGRDCVIGPAACIGWLGLAYHDRADGARSFFPHLAGVRIGDRVDVGAQACICRGMLSHTVVGDDAKLGSLVYVSHGVVVGARAWVSAGTAIAGHASVGSEAVLGIGSVVIDNVEIGAGARVGAGSVVTQSAGAQSLLHGVPATAVARMRRFGPTPRE